MDPDVCPDRDLVTRALSRRLTEADLLELAGEIMAIVSRMRSGALAEVDDRTAHLQSAVIALAARGLLSRQRVDAIPADAFTCAPRLFAWYCAARSARILGKRCTFFHVRYVLATAPRPKDMAGPPRITKADVAAYRAEHGLEATEEWLLSIARGDEPGSMARLWRETEWELDLAEMIERPARDAPSLLIADHRARQVRAAVQPLMTAIERGEPIIDTAARLREAADIFDGKTGGRA